MRNFVRCAALAAVMMPMLASAQDLETALEAFDAGDHEKALQELRPLAEQGNAEAQSRLGLMYLYSFALDRDVTEALRWSRKAADQGDAIGKGSLGLLYYHGYAGLEQDYAEALRWFLKAAEGGHVTSQVSLGNMHRDGIGVAQDYVTAHMWYNIATAAGSVGARENRDEIASRMTADAIAEAQRRARVCMESGYQNCE